MSLDNQPRVFHISLDNPLNIQTALNTALERIGPYQKYTFAERFKETEDVELVKDELYDACAAFKPDIVFCQIQQDFFTPDFIRSLPGFKINWSGDVREPIPEWYIDCGKKFDLTLMTNMDDVEELREAGVSADFLQIGYNDKLYIPEGEKVECPDIVFMGNHSGTQFPLCRYRVDMVNRLFSNFPDQFGVYGGGWPRAIANYSMQPLEEAKVLRSAKIVINLSHFERKDYYSDRLLRAMGSNAFVLSHRWPGCQEEFRDRAHLAYWDDLDHLMDRIKHYLSRPQEMEPIRHLGYEKVRHNYTWEHQIIKLKKLYYEYSKKESSEETSHTETANQD